MQCLLRSVAALEVLEIGIQHVQYGVQAAFLDYREVLELYHIQAIRRGGQVTALCRWGPVLFM